MDGEVFQGEAADGHADISTNADHDIAIPMFGYKNHAGIDRAHGFIRGWTVTSASAHDGAQLRNVVTKDNTASTVWPDSAYHRTDLLEQRRLMMKAWESHCLNRPGG